MRAVPAAASASCKPRARAKCPRWLMANCTSQPSGVCCSGCAITAGVVDQDVEGALPRGHKGGNGGTVGEFEADNLNPVVASRGCDIGGDAGAGVRVAH